MKEKRCSRCKKTKPLSEFYKSKSYGGGYDVWCGECRRTYHKEYYRENKERFKAYQESKKVPCPDCGKLILPTSDYCNPCSSRRIAQRPEFRTSSSERMQAYWENDPGGEKRKAASERLKKRWQDPSSRKELKEASRQLGERRQGQRMDEEFSRRVSEGLKKAYAEGRIQRYEETEESRRKRSETVKKLWERGHYDEMLLKICREPTDLELELAQALDKLELGHTPQYRPDDCPYIYDEYVPALNLLVEADGEHWHFSAWAESQGVPEKDARKNQWAAENGYCLIRIRGRDMRDFGIEACLLPHLAEQQRLL